MSLWDLAKIVHDGPHDGRKLCTMPLVHKVMSTRLWTPGMPVMEETPTEPFLGAVGFGQRDDDSWAANVSCLQQRKVATFKVALTEDEKSLDLQGRRYKNLWDVVDGVRHRPVIGPYSYELVPITAAADPRK